MRHSEPFDGGAVTNPILRCVMGQAAGQSTNNFAINYSLCHERYTEQENGTNVGNTISCDKQEGVNGNKCKQRTFS